LPATWQRSTYIASGSGDFEFWLKLDGAHSQDRIDGELIECGRVMPDFQSSPVDETHVLGFPDSIFDHVPQYLEAVPVAVTLGGSLPGATLALPQSAFLMGAALSNADSATWPSEAAAVASIDQDRDGLPGITALYRQDANYDLPRTGAMLGADRADQPYIASRLVFALDGALTTCTESVGSADVSFVDTRILGCSTEDPGAECSAAEAEFLDANCIDYALGSASYVMRKVADGSTCSDIRGAL
jgi:hypothetical protein